MAQSGVETFGETSPVQTVISPFGFFSRGRHQQETTSTTPTEPETAEPSGADLCGDPAGPDRDCGDFATHAEAQAFFLAAGGPDRDPHGLDADHDGLACESLP